MMLRRLCKLSPDTVCFKVRFDSNIGYRKYSQRPHLVLGQAEYFSTTASCDFRSIAWGLTCQLIPPENERSYPSPNKDADDDVAWLPASQRRSMFVCKPTTGSRRRRGRRGGGTFTIEVHRQQHDEIRNCEL